MCCVINLNANKPTNAEPAAQRTDRRAMPRTIAAEAIVHATNTMPLARTISEP